MFLQIEQQIKSILINWGISQHYFELIRTILIIALVIILCLLLNYIAKLIISKIIKRIVDKSETDWDDIIYEKKVFNHLSHFVPALLIYNTVKFDLVYYPSFISIVQSCTYIYMIGITMFVLVAFFNALNEIYNLLPSSKGRSIKGFIQIGNIIVYFIGGILIISILLNKNPAVFLTGLGAFAAILLLIFKDALMGLVAGVQLAANDMVKIGDWISIPSKNTDGTISEISLTTIKVQNWDKTISMLPSYTLISETFINYRGLELNNARRIQRSIRININSIKHINIEMIDKLKSLTLLNDYFEEIKSNIETNGIDTIPTNSLLFIKYIKEYLKTKDYIRKDETLMVRELQPSETGLPIEVYAFCSFMPAIEFESNQTKIFDHLLSILPLFELKVFQHHN